MGGACGTYVRRGDARGLGGYLNKRDHREDLGLDGNIAL